MSLEVSPTAVVSMGVGTPSLSQYGVDASFMSLLLHNVAFTPIKDGTGGVGVMKVYLRVRVAPRWGNGPTGMLIVGVC